MPYNMPKMLSSEFESHSIKIEDFKINTIDIFNPIITKGRSDNFKSNTRNILKYAQDVRFQISES